MRQGYNHDKRANFASKLLVGGQSPTSSAARSCKALIPCPSLPLLSSPTKGITGKTSGTGRARTRGHPAPSSRERSSRTLKKVLACSPP